MNIAGSECVSALMLHSLVYGFGVVQFTRSIRNSSNYLESHPAHVVGYILLY